MARLQNLLSEMVNGSANTSRARDEKILILHPISNYSQLNTEKGVSQYALYLSEVGYDVTLALYENEKNREEEISIPGVEIDRISIINSSPFLKTMAYLLNCDADVIYTQYFFEKRHLVWSVITWLRGIAYFVMIDHTPDFPPLTRSIRRKHWIKLFVLSTFSEQFFGKTQASINQLTSIYPKLEGKIETLPSGVGNEYFSLNNQETKTILYVGRLGGDKNVKSLLSGFNKIKSKYKDWTLEIAGEGENYPEIDTENIIFHGHLEKEEVLKLYSKADIFCQPSLHESFSNVLIEAAASETAIISTKVGVAPTLLEDRGLFIRKNDPDHIAEKLEVYMSDPKKRKSDAKALKESAKKYHIENVSKIVEDRIKNR